MFEQHRDRPLPFQNLLAEFVYQRTYARYIPHLLRRETWFETVSRAVTFLHKHTPQYHHSHYDLLWDDIFTHIYDHDVMPSMRLLWSAGPSAEQDHTKLYNCSYIAVTDLTAFAEILYILMCGTGVGASVQKHHTAKLPLVHPRLPTYIARTHHVEDSREGWANALLKGLIAWFRGDDIHFDYSQVRPNGAPLFLTGGRASGPAPLKKLLDFSKTIVLQRQGQRLRPIDVADIVNMIGEVVVVGGVRRSSEILLFSPHDHEMLSAKSGEWYKTHPHRRMANNSASFMVRPAPDHFDLLWSTLENSHAGEPGVFIQSNARNSSPRRQPHQDFGTNPCGEIILRGSHDNGGGQFCNLTEVVAREDDTLQSLLYKIRVATIIGTIQSTFTHFPYLRKGWAENCQEERLLGVSITGIADCPALTEDALRRLKHEAIKCNQVIAMQLGINPSAAITTVKPSGTVSQMVNSSSGIHVRYAPYYIRRVRIAATDPLLQHLIKQGLTAEPESGSPNPPLTYVLSFPIASPPTALTRHDVSAMDQLNNWLMFKLHYTEHNPSCTIYVKAHEWYDVKNWVYENWDVVGGLSFFPSDDHVYPLAPYEEITREQYLALMETFPKHIDYTTLREYQDDTTGATDYACTGGSCELP
jgi:ribonucleoside-diphosphate reductase alpha chain